jgi:ABC-2 type transport system ATP-binding protein
VRTRGGRGRASRLIGLRRPDAGTIDILGDRYPFGRQRPARLGVQLQEESLPARIKVGEALEFFRQVYGTRRRRVARLAALGVDELITQPFAKLSGGQKRRVVVALALVGDPQLVVLDEPMAGLDPDGQEAVLSLLRTLRAEGIGVLVTVYDLDQAAGLGDRITLLVGGRVVATGRPRDLIAGLGAPVVAVLPGAYPMSAQALHVLGIRRLVRHAGRQYAYGGADLPQRLRGIGGLAALPAGPAAELRQVRLLDVYACGVGETLYSAHHGAPDSARRPGWRR